MDTDQVMCPGCGVGMTIAVNRAVNSREYVCNQCGSAVAGVAVFRRLLGDHRVGEIWNAEQATASYDDPRCGFCLGGMEPRAVENGHAAICKTCQVIWLDKAALGSLTTMVPMPTLAEVGVTKCSNCGAPITSPLAERCGHCGAALEIAPVVVAAPAPQNTGTDCDHLGGAAYWFARAVGALTKSSS
jgi:Zn-finger nucleic acid-binding protein